MTLRERFDDLIVQCRVNRNNSPINDFFKKESRGILFAGKKRELVELIPEAFKYIDYNSISWLFNKTINSLPGFTEAVRKGIFANDLYANGLLYIDIFSHIDSTHIYNDEMLEHLAGLDLSPVDYSLLIKDMCLVNIEVASTFLRMIKDKVRDSKMATSILESIVSGCDFGHNFGNYKPVYENIDIFLERLDNPYELYERVEDDKRLKELVKEKITTNLDTVLPNVTPRQILHIIRLCDKVEDREKAVDYALKHFDEIVDSYSTDTILDLFNDDVKGIPELEEKRKEYINGNFEKLVERIYYAINSMDEDNKHIRENVSEREEIINVIRIVFKEVCENEDVEYSDIQKIGGGAFVNVFQVGDKVVKLGLGRYTEEFPNNPYIVAPLLRKTLRIPHERAFIEVTERVDTVKPGQVSDEELYDLYSKMRSIGLEWLDIDSRNVGRLRKDNIVHWHEELDPTDEALGLSPKVGEEILLKAGDLVIIDSDFIYKEGQVPDRLTLSFEDEEFVFIDKWRKFSERYDNEHGLDGPIK